MNNKQEKLGSSHGVTNKFVKARGSRIADKDQIEFLISTLQKHSNENFFSIGGKYTKDSLQPLADLYAEKMVDPINKFSRINNIDLKKINAESIFNLIEAGEATKRNEILFELAGLTLLLERKTNDIIKCAKLIINRESWTEFLIKFRNEIELTESYIFYYWKKSFVNISKIYLRLNNKKTNWVEGRIYYYDYDDQKSNYKPNDILSLVKVIDHAPVSKHHESFAFYVLHDWQIAQYNIAIPSDIPNQKYFFCSYSTYSRTATSFAGVGILCKEKHVDEKVNEINLNKRIDFEIANLLHEKSIALPYNSGNLKHLPNNKEAEKIRKISGIWKVFTLRNNKPDDASTSEEKGGIEVNYLLIEPSGLIYLKCDENVDNNYTGFVTFPLPENTKLIKCNIQESPADKIYKIQMLLSLKQNNKILEGVIGGWSNRGNPFSSLIRLEKEVSFNDIKENDFEKCCPSFIKKNEIDSSSELTNALKAFFKNSKKYLDLSQDCLPLVQIEHKKIFASIEGCYYLLSRDYTEGLIDRAKLELSHDGTFIADYPDVSYRGIIKEFITSLASNQYIYLDIQFKKLSLHNNWVSFSGAFIFNIENILINDDDKLANKIDMVIGFSLRKNASNLSQVKKELLIPVKEKGKFLQEKSRKYSYAQESFITDNLKTSSNKKLLFVKYKELLRGLRGKENNIMLLSNEQATSDVLRETDYFEVYMNAFLFEILFADDLNYGKVYNYLLQALLHLDKSKSIFNKLNSIFVKYKITERIQRDVSNNINSLFKIITAESSSSKLQSLLEKIKMSDVNPVNTPILKKINHIIKSIRTLK